MLWLDHCTLAPTLNDWPTGNMTLPSAPNPDFISMPRSFLYLSLLGDSHCPPTPIEIWAAPSEAPNRASANSTATNFRTIEPPVVRSLVHRGETDPLTRAPARVSVVDGARDWV